MTSEVVHPTFANGFRGVTKSFQNRNAKLTPAQREEIGRRAREGEDLKKLALEFGVSASYVRTLK